MAESEENSGAEEDNPSFHRTAQDWSRLSGFNYRAILEAVQAGELEAYRMKDGGPYLISGQAFSDWKEGLKVNPRVKPEDTRREQKKRTETRDIGEFALHHVNMNPPFFRPK